MVGENNSQCVTETGLEDTKGNGIMDRENTEECLMVQCSARVCFNTAEKLNYISWFVCVAIAIATFFDTTGAAVAAAIFDAGLFVISNIVSREVKTGADYRAYFDSHVLKEKFQPDTELEKNILRKARRIRNHKKQYFDVQMRNAGSDNPPGVKNWYEPENFLSETDARYECEQENIWWNHQMATFRHKALAGITIAIVAGYLIFAGFLNSFNIWAVLIGYVGLFLQLADRIQQNIRYYGISRYIDGMMSAIDRNSEEQMDKLHAKIDERRRIPVFEMNFFYQRHSADFENEYHG